MLRALHLRSRDSLKLPVQTCYNIFWILLMISFNLIYDSLCHLRWYRSAIFSHLAHGLKLFFCYSNMQIVATNGPLFQQMNEGGSLETVVLRRWGSSIQKFGLSTELIM